LNLLLRLALHALQLCTEPLLTLLRKLPFLIAEPLHALAKLIQLHLRLRRLRLLLWGRRLWLRRLGLLSDGRGSRQ
jgi:hypothetical protein